MHRLDAMFMKNSVFQIMSTKILVSVFISLFLHYGTTDAAQHVESSRDANVVLDELNNLSNKLHTIEDLLEQSKHDEGRSERVGERIKRDELPAEGNLSLYSFF